MYLQRKSIKRSIALVLFTSFFGAPNLAQESFFTIPRKEISVDNRKSLFSAFKISNIDNFSRKQLIASSIINPNLLDIEGPKVSLVFKQAKAKEIFEYLAKIANYGFVWVKNNPNDESKFDNDRLISMTLNDETYKKAFNALLLASGLQAKLHDNVLYVGPNVRNTVFTERASDIYQLNQISASSAADYLANLGASVTKTFTITTSVTSGASQSQAVQGASSSSTTTDQ